jgi:cyclic pyranopterin phosphate synthase
MASSSPLSHYDDAGRARMVDIGGKSKSPRRATAQGSIAISPETLRALDSASLPKGNPFEVARIAAIQATKRTPELIPLCHPLRLTAIDVDLLVDRESRLITATVTVAAEERTGVEMEALVGCSVALLTVYDMLKAVDHTMVISSIRLLEKTGGASDFTAPPAP